MPSLRSLLSDIEPPTIGNPQRVFYVQNTSNSEQNGGRCCLWTVPSGITTATFEMWGAGGDGQGAVCCEKAARMPTNGSYAIKTIDVAEGQCYRICTGGSGCQGACCCSSSSGFPSYIVCASNGTVIGCAPGGSGGVNGPRGAFCYGYICCCGRLSSTGLGDITMQGTGNISVSNCFCRQGIYMFVSGGFGSDRITPDYCASDATRSGVDIMNSCASYPSGSGTPGRACGGGRCFGQHGAGGLVKVSFS